jgi:hypothetical protein
MAKPLAPGKQAEKEVAIWLESCSQQDSGFAFHRFPDARAARGALAAQPSDFLVSLIDKIGFNRTVYLEVKETAQERRLPKAKISQYGSLMKFFWTRADVVVLIYMSQFKHWVFLEATQDNDELFDFPETPTSFLLTGKKTFATAAEALSEIFR